jgi:hypothetical protein
MDVSLLQDVDARKMAIVLDHLERGAATGGHVREIGLVAELFDGRGAIATTADGEGFALDFANRFAIALVPSWNSGCSKTPIGPFQKTSFALRISAL